MLASSHRSHVLEGLLNKADCHLSVSLPKRAQGLRHLAVMHKGADELLCRIVRDTRPRCTWSDSTSDANALDDTQSVLRAKQVNLYLKTATWNEGLW